ncbi:MAG: hypothetical protein ABR507_12690 [Actinomycetota bacterium]|nr:hypothetical protein [Actinomycetota bacterium]
MTNTAKVLVLGPPDGPQGAFVGTVSQVKVRSSARTTGDGVIPMHFGRVRLESDLDLQIFGAERDQAAPVLDAIASGLVGAIVLFDEAERSDPHYAALALDELSQRGVPWIVVVWGDQPDPSVAADALNLTGVAPVVVYGQIDKESVKSSIVSVLETALVATEGAA